MSNKAEQALDESFDHLAMTVMRVKRERDQAIDLLIRFEKLSLAKPFDLGLEIDVQSFISAIKEAQ